MRLCPFLAAPALALPSGYTGLTSHEALEDQGGVQTQKTHKQQLSELDTWQTGGKVGIHAPRDSGSSTLFRLQRQGYRDICLSGPLGRGIAYLARCEGAVGLEVAGQGRYRAESPEALLEEQLGWHLPISHLFWWVCDLPTPDNKNRLTFDTDSRPTCLEQDGWQIGYTRYAGQNDYWLPERLRLHGQDLDVTLVIENWQSRQLSR